MQNNYPHQPKYETHISADGQGATYRQHFTQLMISASKLIRGDEYLIYLDSGERDICVWRGSDFEGDRGSWLPSEVTSVYGPISKETLPFVIGLQSPDQATTAPHDQGE